MAFPIPVDPEFKRLVVSDWLDDFEDRLSDAEYSWRTANELYLSLPPGEGSDELERRLVEARVKLDNLSLLTNENHQQRRSGDSENEQTVPT